MSYRSCVLNGLFVVRWERPSVGDCARYYQELVQASQTQSKPLVGLFIMPENSSAPDDHFKKEQAQLMNKIMQNLSFAIAVFEGTGFAASLKRSALVAILLLSGQRQKIYVRSTVEEALVRNPPGPLGFSANKALDELRAQAFCTGGGPANRPS
jgi:hypothetical protein